MWAGPLQVVPGSRYFHDAAGKPVYLAGWHTWNNFVDVSKTPPLSHTDYLDNLQANRNNLARLWNPDHVNWDWFWPLWGGGAGQISHQQYARTGPGLALDGKPKFDLTQYDPVFFARLTNFVGLAKARGIYVDVMLFECTSRLPDWNVRTNFAWSPYNTANNVNGLTSDLEDLYTLRNPALVRIYENYVRHLVDAVNPYDNVIFEVGNEPQFPANADWATHMVATIKSHEATKPFQHPVGLSTFYANSAIDFLLRSEADWITAGADPIYWTNIPAITHPTKVWFTDSDHIFYPSDGGHEYVWMTFVRGYNNMQMDLGTFMHFVDGREIDPRLNGRVVDPRIRRTLGDTVYYSQRIDLANMTPSTTISSTTYALVSPGQEYLVWQPARESFTVAMLSGTYDYEWFVPDTSTHSGRGVVTVSSGPVRFTPPATHHGGTVLYLRRAPPAAPEGQVREVTFTTAPAHQAAVLAVAPADLEGAGGGQGLFTRRYVDGTSVTVTAPARVSGWTFQHWQKDGVHYDAARTTTLRVSEAHTLTAVYVRGRAAEHVPEAARFQLLYALDLPDQANYNKLGVPYRVDNRASAGPFTRIGYYLELQPASGPAQYVWISMDAFTGDVNRIGVPSAQTGAFLQQPVSGMSVRSSVPGIATGDGLTGNLEFWPGNYHGGNSAGVTGAQDALYDWGDGSAVGDLGYGSMQIHHSAAGQTLLAFNGWGKVGAFGVDLGIGNRPEGHPDWTFAQNASRYSSRLLEVYVANTLLTAIDASRVQGAHVFYNNSDWDGRDPGANALDDDAIAPDKHPLRRGESAGPQHYTSYSRGLNGVMIDVAGLPGPVTASDFVFKVGNDSRPDRWSSAPLPEVVVRSRAGAGGSDRVTLIWPDFAIQKQWLEVTVLPTARTGLAAAETFYFGNAVGDSLNSLTDARVDAVDELLAKANLRTSLNPAGIDFPFDYNRDKRVDAADQLIARGHRTASPTALTLLDLTGARLPAEADDYQLVYSLDIPEVASFNSTGVPYSVDHAASTGPFDRIAYYLELHRHSGEVSSLWVSMDAFTADPTRIGVPSAGSGGFFQQPVFNLNVHSTVPGVVTGEGLAGGFIEFWPGNYHEANALNVAGASSEVFDWGDWVHRGDVGYGSMQVHNSASGQTLFACNGWGGVAETPVDLGIGNQPTGYPDWTFARNASEYAVRRLQIYVRPF